MPHTNRARRAEHYRAIAAAADESKGSNHKKFEASTSSKKWTGSSGGPYRGRGKDDQKTSSGNDAGRESRGASAGRGNSFNGVTEPTKKPSLKNQLRTFQRLLDKLVREVDIT